MWGCAGAAVCDGFKMGGICRVRRRTARSSPRTATPACPQEGYADLPRKTLLFFDTVLRQYAPKYIVKVDDDVYFRLDRVPAAVEQWASIGAGAMWGAGSDPCWRGREGNARRRMGVGCAVRP